jgi:serine/threonine-protein kinase
MGVVWAARQRALDRVVAVKRLGEPPFAARDASALVAEARTAGGLEHPAIVPVHDLTLDADGSPMLVMKRVEGATLGALVADRSHPAWPELERRHGDQTGAIVDALMRVCDALELAHQRGVVHRDVKCDNVMLGAFGEVYLLDWGVAVRPEDASEAIEIVGTPSSLAPEMVRGDARQLDARSDVYLLGATLHEALTGRPRHEGATLHAVLLAAYLSEPPADAPGMPEDLASLVRRATAADPADRPATAARFREELAAFLRHRAAGRLADDAIARLDAVDARPEALGSPEAGRDLTEARFALTRVVREWPENVRAAEALDRTLAVAARAELARDSPGAAAALLAEMRAPAPDLAEAIRTAEARAAERASLAAVALEEARERDSSRSAAVRRLMGGVFVVSLGVLVASTFAIAGPSPETVIGYGTAFFLDVAFLVVSVVLLYATRARVLVNRWSRDAAGLFVVAALGTCLSHGVGWLRGDDLALRGDAPTQVMFAVLFGVGSMLVSRRLLLPAALACGAAIASATWPALSLWASVVTVLSAVVVLARTPESERDAARRSLRPPPK